MSYPFTVVSFMPVNLEEATENVVAMSQEVGYDPQKHTNWSMLPNEMKEKVIKRMDLKSRIRLAVTSSSENKMVKKKKFKLNGLHVYTDGTACCIAGFSLVGDRRVRYEFLINRCLFTGQFKQIIEQIFKECDVKSFFFYNVRPTRDISEEAIAQLIPFRFERFVCGKNWDVNMFVLKNCVALKSVSIDVSPICDTGTYSCEELFQLPAILGAEHMECLNVWNAEVMHPTITTWLETSTPVGKSIELSWISGAKNLDLFVDKFKNRIIHKSDDHLLLRMNNDDRQLLLRQTYEKKYINHVLIKVIPVGLPKAEYTTHPFNKWQYSLPRFNALESYWGHIRPHGWQTSESNSFVKVI